MRRYENARRPATAPCEGKNKLESPQTESMNMCTRLTWARLLALALAVLSMVGTGFGAARAASRAPRVPIAVEKLTVALASTPHAALLHLAARKGYFADEGLDVSLVPVSHGKAAMDLLEQGKVDLAAAAEVPFVLSVMKGQPVSIAATVASISTEMAVVARKDRAIAAPRDLVGKNIGVPLGTSGEYYLWAFLIRHKLPPDSIKMVDLPPGQLTQQLASGAVDAASTWQPVRFAAEAALGDNGLAFVESDAYTVTHVVVGNTAFLKSHATALQKFTRALLRAERFTKVLPQQAMALVAEQMKVTPQALQQGWQDLELRVDLRQSQLITLEDEARWAIARGYVDTKALPNFLSHLYLDALLTVQPDRVTVVR